MSRTISASPTGLLRVNAARGVLFVRQGALLAQRFDISRRTVTGEPIIVADSVVFDPMTSGAAISTSEAAMFAYRSGRGEVTQLAWFDRSGRALVTLVMNWTPPAR